MTQSDVHQIIVAFEQRLRDSSAEMRALIKDLEEKVIGPLASRVAALDKERDFADGVDAGLKAAKATQRSRWRRFEGWVVPLLASLVGVLGTYIATHPHR